MNSAAIEPVHWSTQTLIAQGSEVIQELAGRAVGTQTAYFVMLGRCMLAMDETRLTEELGFSSSVHYAVQRLGIGRTEAYDARRVAMALESLPMLTEAAEFGRIAWSKLVLVTKKASLETEEFWLQISRRKNCRELQRLCAACEYGKLPWEEGQQLELPVTRLHLHLDAERGELFEQMALSLSQKVGRTLSMAEAIEHLAVEELSSRPATPKRVENMRKEARRSANAKRRNHALLVEDARGLADEWGLSGQSDALAAALGVAPVDLTGEVGYSPVEASDVTEMLGQIRQEQGHPGLSFVEASHRSEEIDTPAVVEAPIGFREERVGAGDRDGSAANSRAVGEAASDVVRTSGRIRNERVGPSDSDGSAANSRAEAEAASDVVQTSGRVVDELAAASCKPPCADGELELVEIGSARFVELLAAGHMDDKWDWQNRQLLFNPRARKATVAQRREILRRDGYCCRTPGCPHRMWLQLHHTVFFSRCGKTVRQNLVPLCFRCHTNVHAGRLKITGNADGTLTFTDAQGSNLDYVHALGIAEWLNFWVGWTGGESDRHQPKWARPHAATG